MTNCKYKVQYENGSWSEWGTLEEIVYREESYIAVRIKEIMTRKEYEAFKAKFEEKLK